MHRSSGLTQGTETSQYLQERKSTETPSVAASESGLAQTVPFWGGVAGVNQELQRLPAAEESGKAHDTG
jgi:hypothetical protein